VLQFIINNLSLAQREVHTPKNQDTVVPLIRMGQLTDNMSCDWVVRHVRKNILYGTKGIQLMYGST